VHGEVSLAKGFDKQFMAKTEPTTLSDVKSAYLIAFVVLGYSWCTASRLGGLRAALASSACVPTSDALVTCGLASADFPERSVVEVTSPVPLVLVVGPDRELTVALPGARTPDVAAACVLASQTPVQARMFEWPLTVRETARALDLEARFVKPEDAWDRGMTFHLDRCDSGHFGIANPARQATRAINRALR
jgi:hypothetical protein